MLPLKSGAVQVVVADDVDVTANDAAAICADFTLRLSV